jgi:hypothetical protein
MSKYPAVYVGMPSVERRFRVRKSDEKFWGEIICGGPCEDSYARIDIYNQIPGQRFVKLQAAALRSFRAAELALGHKIFLTGSWRSCSLQASLYRSDPSRFANPNTTAHCRGLAIDVSTDQSQTRLKNIHRALAWRGWHQSRPDDEPWHWSFGIQV